MSASATPTMRRVHPAPGLRCGNSEDSEAAAGRDKSSGFDPQMRESVGTVHTAAAHRGHACGTEHAGSLSFRKHTGDEAFKRETPDLHGTRRRRIAVWGNPGAEMANGRRQAFALAQRPPELYC